MCAMRDDLIASLQKLESDLIRRQQAVEHLREVIRLIDEEACVENSTSSVVIQVSNPTVTPKVGMAQLVDRFIELTQDGDSFTVGDAVQAVVTGGYQETEAVRANVSSILSRRARSGDIERIGSRGSFAKPLQPFPEPEEQETDPQPWENVSRFSTEEIPF